MEILSKISVKFFDEFQIEILRVFNENSFNIFNGNPLRNFIWNSLKPNWNVVKKIFNNGLSKYSLNFVNSVRNTKILTGLQFKTHLRIYQLWFFVWNVWNSLIISFRNPHEISNKISYRNPERIFSNYPERISNNHPERIANKYVRRTSKWKDYIQEFWENFKRMSCQDL